MSDETVTEPVAEPVAEQPSTREMAAALVSLGIQEQEGRVHQANAALHVLQVQLQAARVRAPFEIERLARDMETSLQ
jgi:hypothetical protein